MKKLVSICFLCFVSIMNGQNLVPNPSFEDSVLCPTMISQLSASKFWTNPSFVATPDYFNSCSTANGGVAGVPSNISGYQNARTGTAYAGIITGGDAATSNYREYIATNFISPLIAGNEYLISFHVNLANSSFFATSKIGAYISTSGPGQGNNSLPMNFVIPQIQNANGFIADTLNWVEIAGIYTAMGGESVITIGNFYDDLNTDTMRINQGFFGAFAHYYYIDDVSVLDLGPVGIKKYSNNEYINIYPVPANTNFTIDCKTLNVPYSLQLRDVFGITIKTIQMKNKEEIVSVSDISDGVYFVYVFDNEQHFFITKKIVVKH